jgi:hypothetical protein
MSEQCALIGDVIHCRCGKPSSHYGTMGERGARVVREALASKPMNYVHEVPDHCDRIIWRKSYYHLENMRAVPETPVALDYKLPCDVRLPIGMSIGKGCPLSTLMTAFRQRESWSDEDTRFQDERAQAVRRAILDIPINGPAEKATAPLVRWQCPWPDFAGNPIFEGDTLVHPDGMSGRVLFVEGCTYPNDAWRVDYGDGGPAARLCLQIGDKGQARVAVKTGGES